MLHGESCILSHASLKLKIEMFYVRSNYSLLRGIAHQKIKIASNNTTVSRHFFKAYYGSFADIICILAVNPRKANPAI